MKTMLKYGIIIGIIVGGLMSLAAWGIIRFDNRYPDFFPAAGESIGIFAGATLIGCVTALVLMFMVGSNASAESIVVRMVSAITLQTAAGITAIVYAFEHLRWQHVVAGIVGYLVTLRFNSGILRDLHRDLREHRHSFQR